MTLALPNAQVTRHGSVSVQTRVRAWSCDSTFLVVDRPERCSHQAIGAAEAARIAALQGRHAMAREMVVVDRAVGAAAGARVGVRLYVDAASAHVAAVHDMLWYPPAGEARAATIVCTPALRIPGYPDGRVVTVDLERGVTRVCGSDFAAEAKRGALRTWSRHVWDAGGLPLHAAVTIGGGRIAVLTGRPATGKSTLVFADPARRIPCQEDRVAWMTDGSLVPAERAFFAPARLAAEGSSTIAAALRAPASHLQNVSAGGSTGRVVFGSDARGAVGGRGPALIAILVRNQNVLPAVARLGPDRAAAVFAAALEGVPQPGPQLLAANPLLPLSAAAQAARLREQLWAQAVEAYVLNTGRVGGPAERPGSRDVEPRHSAAIVAALVAGGIEWEHEASLGCEVAVRVPGLAAGDAGLLRPAELYRRAGRGDEYRLMARRLTSRWAECAVQLERPSLPRAA